MQLLGELERRVNERFVLLEVIVRQRKEFFAGGVVVGATGGAGRAGA
jgi:hypothetical protein